MVPEKAVPLQPISGTIIVYAYNHLCIKILKELMRYHNFNIGKKNEYFVQRCVLKNMHLFVEHHNDDCMVNGKLPYVNLLPDIVFRCNLGGRFRHFAVECKRRTKDSYSINVCKKNQLSRYSRYSANCPTYIFLSIGGSINHPGATYLIPIDSVKTRMTRDDLQFYSWDYHQMMFFHTDTGRITY